MPAPASRKPAPGPDARGESQARRYEEARAALEAHQSRHSYEHGLRTAETAARIAEAYGADAEQARLAGLLHDWSRDTDPRVLLTLAERSGFTVTEVDRAVPYLLHAKVAAAELRETLPWLSEDALEAVASHTLGCLGTCDVAKIVYIADMIEPDRRYPAAHHLREEVGRVTLDALYVQAYAQTVCYLVERRRRIHPDTLLVWNALVGGGEQ